MERLQNIFFGAGSLVWADWYMRAAYAMAGFRALGQRAGGCSEQRGDLEICVQADDRRFRGAKLVSRGDAHEFAPCLPRQGLRRRFPRKSAPVCRRQWAAKTEKWYLEVGLTSPTVARRTIR